MDFGMSTEFLKTVGVAMLSVLGFKVVERYFNSKEAVDEQAAFRIELRAELDTMRRSVTALSIEVTEWRKKYYDQLELNARLQSELNMMRLELDEYKVKVSDEFDITPPTHRER